MALGRLRWTLVEYYRSSPQEFYYACLGYFDERDENMLLMRKVAQAAGAGFIESSDFNKFWPVEGAESQAKNVSKEMIDRIKKAHGIK